MKGCFGCHNMTGAAQGQAKSACNVCHLTETDGRMKTMFATGELKPPRWLRNAQHTPDFIERHKRVAADDAALCANCHTERFCTDCHDGKVRPRSVHPNDWISMHPIAARQDNPRCTSCHQEQSFCLAVPPARGRHDERPQPDRQPVPPRRMGRLEQPRGRQPGHHAWEAQRNLNACVSCHTERDCAICHAAERPRRARRQPPPARLHGELQAPIRSKRRPCLVCHDIQSAEIGTCR